MEIDVKQEMCDEYDVQEHRNLCLDSGKDSLQENPVCKEANEFAVDSGNHDEIVSPEMKSSKQSSSNLPKARETGYNDKAGCGDEEMKYPPGDIHRTQNFVESDTHVMLESYHCNDQDTKLGQLNEIDNEVSNQDNGQNINGSGLATGNMYIWPTLIVENNRGKRKFVEKVNKEPSSAIVCEICNKSFKLKRYYTRHLATHRTKDITQNTENVTEKNRGNKEKFIFFCDICKKEFLYKSVLEDHKLKHVNSRPHVCDVCGMAYKKLKHLRDHIISKHDDKRYGEKKTYFCEKCEKSFRYKSCFEDHNLIHQNIRPFACKLCGSTFKILKTLRRHLVTQHNDKSLGDIKQHPCHICSKVFVGLSKLNLHLTVHFGGKLIVCEICGSEFKSAKSLKNHMLLHDNNSKNTKIVKNYSIHVDDINRTKEHGCKFCELKFKTKTKLLAHWVDSNRDGIHKVDRLIHSCHVCGKVFHQKNKLRRHAMIHEDLRPFQCTVCGSSFKQACHLQSHMLTHQKVKLPCENCQLEFPKKQDLKIHQITCIRDPNTSMNVSDCKCQICGQCFVNDYDLNDHKAEHEQCKDTSSVLQNKMMTDVEINNISHSADNINESVHFSPSQNEKKKVTPNVDIKTSLIGFKNMDTFTSPTNMFEETEKSVPDGQDSTEIHDNEILKHNSIRDTEDERYNVESEHDTLLENLPTQIMVSCKKGFKCSQCCNIYDSPEILREHTRKYQCCVCDINFCQFEKFKSHKHFNESDQTYGCQFCKRSFQVEDNFKLHIKWHEENTDQKVHHCKVCKDNFKKEEDLDRHLLHHQYYTNFLCHECGEGFAEKSALKSHKKVHGTHKCGHCGGRYFSKSSLDDHFKEEHAQKVGTRYKCRFCEKTYARRLNWRVHELHHTGEKSFACEICGKLFYTKAELKIHSVVHTKEKRYICQICQKGFSQAGALYMHKKKMHNSVS